MSNLNKKDPKDKSSIKNCINASQEKRIKYIKEYFQPLQKKYKKVHKKFKKTTRAIIDAKKANIKMWNYKISTRVNSINLQITERMVGHINI